MIHSQCSLAGMTNPETLMKLQGLSLWISIQYLGSLKNLALKFSTSIFYILCNIIVGQDAITKMVNFGTELVKIHNLFGLNLRISFL